MGMFCGSSATAALNSLARSALLITVLVAWSFLRSARVKRALDEAEARSKSHGR